MHGRQNGTGTIRANDDSGGERERRSISRLLVPMVCMLGRGRMAAMVRLLKVGSFQEITREEAINEKIATQSIDNEFHDADEANLLEEEDMHIFDCRPLTDPLHLVCCNACKKPIKASQYSAHADRCGPSNCMNDVLQIDGGSNHKKPPRKGRKLIQPLNGKQEKSLLMDANHVGGSASNIALDNHSRAIDSSETTSGGCELEKKASSRREVPGNASSKYQSVTKFVEHGLVNNQHHRRAPAPLASKIYYSRGDHHLRWELCHLFHEACAKEHGREFQCPEEAQENDMLSSQISSGKLPHGTVRDDVAPNQDT
ncbi:hypothetical protein OPV22_028758 [Ensete ventricosum]|uniref:SAGA-associated factor 11 n=1 Tax=Ensete ventricosum TaxID=4639 RepID=A0AAV8Q9G8_ENSVE|nr:hypothetical protein OPV22_028758 [Ensete ventricosum]